MKHKLVAIVGPTATGKSDLAIQVAKHLDAEIISGDAFQFYKGMDIGTAKVSVEDRLQVTHHLIDIFDPDDKFSVADYQRLVRLKIQEIDAKGKSVIIVGGSGLYIKSVLYDYQFIGDSRSHDDTDFSTYPTEELHDLLKKNDPDLAAVVHPNNRRRIIRSLELAGSNAIETRKKGKTPYYDDCIIIGLELDRGQLYRRIDSRVDAMIENGLVDETRALFEKQVSSQAMAAIGYKELFGYFRKETDLNTAIQMIKQNSRRYAKRQLTWFKNQMQVDWIDVTARSLDETLQETLKLIKK
ncbi:MAG: tRNA (adenosine(37)-N6)-dimethylallyltransferase MiaA [Bacilli bacterium]|nr:tRNA (adenosine(37)-N6)-dimethylallyltransferase MiaA [Bacilli bacterium]MBN2696854.1 tRNA (adenosine(37)-N6)-dimethylallyltransferase MiaA [Bacilli bacterium]